MPNDKLNGSVERLAVAMRDVFTEAVENAVECSPSAAIGQNRLFE
jgi:hypothetical protein